MATTAPEASLEPSRSFIAVNLLTCSLLWGSSYLFIKLLSGDVPALAIAASRGLLGAAVLSLWSLGRGRSPLPGGEGNVEFFVELKRTAGNA